MGWWQQSGAERCWAGGCWLLGLQEDVPGKFCFPEKLLGKAGAASQLPFTAAAGTGSAHHFCLFGSEREAAEGL